MGLTVFKNRSIRFSLSKTFHHQPFHAYYILFDSMMCGRTVLSLQRDQIQCACSYKPKGSSKYVRPDWLPEHNAGKEYTPSSNIAPTDVSPVLISSSKYKNAASTDRVLKPMMWGVIPPWHKGEYKTHNLSTNNCRLENIKGSKLFSPLLNNGCRCVIVAEGFYEWQTTNKTSKEKQPYYIYSPQSENIMTDDSKTWNNSYNEDTGWSGIRLIHMAGVYNVWQNDETIIYSYSIITMESNNTFDWLHHRMPAILDSDERIQAWLDIDNVNPDMALSYLKPIQVISWHPVSTIVNNSRNKSEDCNKRVNIEKKKSIQKTLNTWFTKPEKQKSNMNIPDAKRVKR